MLLVLGQFRPSKIDKFMLSEVDPEIQLCNIEGRLCPQESFLGKLISTRLDRLLGDIEMFKERGEHARIMCEFVFSLLFWSLQ